MKYFLMILTAFLAAGSAFASEKVLDRCEGYIPAYFVELIKVEEAGSVVYQVNKQGNLKEFVSLSKAQEEFKKGCDEVRSWE